MYHILIQFWGLTLLQAPWDLPAGCNRGYLEWASIVNASKFTRVWEKVCFWENASPIISCLISYWKSERAPSHPSYSPISVRGDKNVKKPIWTVICDAHKWWRYAENVGLKKKCKDRKRDEYWFPSLNEAVGKTEMKKEGEREGKNARAFGKCPTSNNTDLIKEMTHLLHASAFSKDCEPADQRLLTNTHARTYTNKHRRTQWGTHINLHVNTGRVSSSRVNVSRIDADSALTKTTEEPSPQTLLQHTHTNRNIICTHIHIKYTFNLLTSVRKSKIR